MVKRSGSEAVEFFFCLMFNVCVFFLWFTKNVKFFCFLLLCLWFLFVWCFCGVFGYLFIIYGLSV